MEEGVPASSAAAERPVGNGHSDDDGRGETRRQIRGSTLLLVGRVGAVGANLLTQVLIARYLSKTDFGAFAYALSIVALFESAVSLGLDRAIPRFLPLYEERGEYRRFFGTLLFVIGTIAGLGLAAVLLVMGVGSWLTGTVIDDPLAVSLLMILILLAPLEALDAVLTDVFAVFGRPRAIFVRKYILAPGLRLVVVLLLVLGSFEVPFLAAGYVAAGAVGILLYVGLVPAALRARGILGHFDIRALDVDIRSIVSYTVPLLSSDLVLVFMAAFDALVLGYTHGTEAVGSVKVIEGAARTNALVATSFSLLFVPVATRFFARGEHRAVNDLYWQTAAWMAVLTFPIFALTFGLAEPLTVLLFDERYRSSAVFLAIIAVGRYIDAAFGANGLALRVYGRMRAIVATNFLAAGFHLAASLILIPTLGPLGVAIAVCSTFVVYNAAKQIVLGRTTEILAFNPRYATVYAAIVVAAVVIAGVQWIVQPPLVVGVATAGLGSLAILVVARNRLRVEETFPELLRIPGMRLVIGSKR